MKQCELLAPAGNLSKFDMALRYGADSIYLGGKRFGLRVLAGNFDQDELKLAVDRAHAMGKRVYVTVNLFARDGDFEGMAEYLIYLDQIGVDALIIADVGVIQFVQKTIPNMEIHLSTQANTMNTYAANFWHDHGVKRIVLARELHLTQIEAMRKSVPDSLELEVFVHGSMCMAYSGRCAISSYLTGREANQGHCTQPCRWEYHLVEQKRPGEIYPIEEDEKGLHFFNSKDLNMMPHLKALLDTGVDSLKIEGRMKSEHYVAAVTSAYRNEIDSYYQDPANYTPDASSVGQLSRVTYRPYTTGFFFGGAHEELQNVEKAEYIKQWDYIAKVVEVTGDPNKAWVVEFNPFELGDMVEILHPDGSYGESKLVDIRDEAGEQVNRVNHPRQKVLVTFTHPVEELAILRKLRD